MEPEKILWPGWETVRQIGRGSFGAVYEIERNVFGHKEKAALKIITIPQDASDIDELLSDGYDEESITMRFEEYLHDIMREYSIMADMKGCANIVYCDDVKYIQHDNGMGWDILIKMELLTALPYALDKTVKDEQVIKMGTDICSALAFCEKQNLIHRDIKPQNIFVALDGTYKLGDFGIAKAAERTTSGTKTGTYKYMAPEVYNNQPYGVKADIYSLGLVLYWLLNERRTPFLPLPPTIPTSTEEDKARARRFCGDPIPAPGHGSKELQRIVLKACAFNQKDRYQNAEEMLADLRALDSNGQVYTKSVLDSEDTVKIIPDPDAQEKQNKMAEIGQLPTNSTVSGLHEIPPYKEDKTVGAFEVNGNKNKTERTTEQKKKRGFPAVLGTVAVLIIIAAVYFLYPQYGEWSEWSPEAPEEINGRKIETSTEYRFCDLELVNTDDPSKVVGTVENEEFTWTEWSDWQDWQESEILEESQENYELEVEKKVQYRYRDKETTTSTSDSLDGWALLNSQTTWSDYGNWSSWSTTAVSQSDSRQVETKTQYRYRTIQTTNSASPISDSSYELYDTATSYGNWSSWTTTPYSSSSTLDVETKQVELGTRYLMGHYCTGNVPGAQYKTASSTHTLNTAFNENCEYHSLGWYDSLSSFTQGNGGYIGSTCSNSCWTWYIMDQDTTYETQYRYRSKATTYFYKVYSSWSSWSDTAQSSSSTKEVQTQTLYRYRDRTANIKNTFWRWSDFSNWADNVVTSTPSREVETRTLFRSRDRRKTVIYSYYDWGTWSDWQTNNPQESDSRKVETRTVYRYADRE